MNTRKLVFAVAVLLLATSCNDSTTDDETPGNNTALDVGCVSCVDVATPIDDTATGGSDSGPTDVSMVADMAGADAGVPCGPGFEGQPGSCSDIDECVVVRCSANAICTNTPGSFTCECVSGWVGDGRSCVAPTGCMDDAECGANAACDLAQSICLCNPGWAGDGLACADVDECADATDDCDANATCANMDGGFDCACDAGWSGTGQACSDVDECATGMDNCDANASCANSPGTFSCSCDAGYAGSGTTCTDEDECANATDTCDANATCTNTPGAYTCACDVPYVGDGFTCSTSTTTCRNGNDCDANAACVGQPKICVCEAGWAGDGATCSDVDECANGTDNCDANASCSNSTGSFSCSCDQGWTGPGTSCLDFDECTAGTDNCDVNASCTNTTGAFTCACDVGWTGTGLACSDVDECAAGTHDCDVNATCANTNGSFTCACNAGWVGDGKTCGPPGTCDPTDLDALVVTASVANTGGSGPVFGAALTGGGAVLAWTDGSGAHLTEVDATGVATGTQHDIAGTRLYGLGAHDTGWAVLVARGSDELALVAVSPAGVVQIDQNILGAVPHDVIGNEWFGSSIRQGRLTWTGSAWATYNTVQRLWPDNVAHYGDTLRYYDSTGVQQSGGWGWGCSHSMDVRIAHNGTRIGPVCSSDCFPSKGVHFDHRAQKLYDDPASTCTGGYFTSLGGVTPVSDGFWVAFTATDMRQSHDVALVKVMNDASKGAITWFTADANDDRYLHSAMYGTDLVLGWATSGMDTFIRADATTGAAIGTGSAVTSSELTTAGDFFVLANGEVAWPTRDSNGLVLGRLTFCP